MTAMALTMRRSSYAGETISSEFVCHLLLVGSSWSCRMPKGNQVLPAASAALLGPAIDIRNLSSDLLPTARRN
jgi:hypothetical protein